MLMYHPHIPSGVSERREINSVTQLVEFMRDSQSDEGELFVNRFSGMKIYYNVRTGYVSLVSTEVRSWINPIFSESACKTIIYPVCEAISLYAKLKFLLAVGECDQELYQQIQKRHLNHDGSIINLSAAAIENTYNQIVKWVDPRDEFGILGVFKLSRRVYRPNHLAIYNILRSVDFNSITSLNDIIETLDNVRKHFYS